MVEEEEAELLERFRIGNRSSNGDSHQDSTGAWKRKSEIGAGAFATVYLESNAATGKVRAVKEVRKEAQANWNAEIFALAHFSKTTDEYYFVRFFGWFENESSIFITMEFLELGNLRLHMESSLPEIQARHISVQLLSALSVLHRERFVHRDIKPENILVACKKPDWRIKIADFAYCKRDGDGPDPPLFTTLVTHQRYMAPEEMDILPEGSTFLYSDNNGDNKVDVWAAGVVIYEIMCNKKPFPSFRQLFRYCSGEERFPGEPLQEFHISEPAHLLLHRLLSPSPATRPTAEEALTLNWFQMELSNRNQETSVASELESAPESSSNSSISSFSTQTPNTQPPHSQAFNTRPLRTQIFNTQQLHPQPPSMQLDTQTLNAQQPNTLPRDISSFRTSAQIVSDVNFQSQPNVSAIVRHTQRPHQSSRVEIENSSITHSSYTAGWICAIPTALAAAVRMLDRKHERLGQSRRDHNSYVLGRIGHHDIAITCLPDKGNVSAAIVAEHMTMTFPAIKFVLMVGVGGGVPSSTHDIRLGDVVVGYPIGANAGVMQYRSGKMRQGKRFEYTGFMNRPPKLIINAVNHLRADHLNGNSEISQIVNDAVARYPRTLDRWSYPGQGRDVLFQPDYTHVDDRDPKCQKCDSSRKLTREPRDSMDPETFYGLIASGDLLMRDSSLRDELRDDYGVLCFEMEAAGLMNHFPCLVIRGICDYCDSHRNKNWQPYAALTAAAYARELLKYVP